MNKKQSSPDRSKKTSDKNAQHPGQKGFKKFFKGDAEKASSGREERPRRKATGFEDRKYNKSSEDAGERTSRGAFRRDEKPFRSEKGDRYGSSPDRKDKRASFDKEKKPFRSDKSDRYSSSPDRKDKRTSFGKEEKPFKKSDRGDRYDSSPDKKDKGPRTFGKADKQDRFKNKPERPDRYAHAFGKLDDEELAAYQEKVKAKKEEREKGASVSFSKSIEKWEEKSDGLELPEGRGKKYDGKREFSAEDRKQRHSKEEKFKRKFDYENDHEKAYSAKADGRIRKKKAIEEDEDEEDDRDLSLPEGKMPLNKYIAHCDVCSRRDAVALIKEGKVKVNGETITEPGYKVTDGEEITLNGKKLTVQKNLVYILLNKPKGYITTTDDPKGRKTVMDIVQSYIDERVFPIGRLDRNTTGLLLLTNDGELAQKLSHPKYEVRKVYQVKLAKAVSKNDFDKIAAGLTLEDGPVKVDAIEYLDSKDEIGLEIHSGKNRIVRRIFESLGYEVEKLDRVMYAGLTKKNILRGKWRFLTKQEVINLKHFK